MEIIYKGNSVDKYSFKVYKGEPCIAYTRFSEKRTPDTYT